MSIDQETMVSSDAPFQRPPQFGDLIAQSALGQLGQRLGIAFAFHEARKIARPEAPNTSLATAPNWMLASSSTF